jgi:hypothetical protein
MSCENPRSGRPARSSPAARAGRDQRLTKLPKNNVGQPYRQKAGQPACPWGSPFAKRRGNLPISIIPRPGNFVTICVSIFLPFLELKNRFSIFYFFAN